MDSCSSTVKDASSSDDHSAEETETVRNRDNPREGNQCMAVGQTVTPVYQGRFLTIGNVKIDMKRKRLGRGTFGEVRKAVDIHTNELRAVKRIDINEEDINEISTELTNLINVPLHKNLVQFFNCFVSEEPECCWFVTEFCDLGDLQNFVKENNPPFEIKMTLMAQISSGLKTLHSVPVVHRDIKPANIVLASDENGQPVAKITDYGFSKVVNMESAASRTALFKTFVGTPAFQAPEFFDAVLYTKSVDIFALGLVYLSLLQYKPGDQYLMPIFKNFEGNKEIPKPFGQEMRDARVERRSQPTIVVSNECDTPQQRTLKKLIKKMVSYDGMLRPQIEDVVKALGIIAKKAQHGSAALPTSHTEELIETPDDPDPSILCTDYNPEEFNISDIVKVNSHKKRVEILQDSLFGSLFDKSNLRLGEEGELVRKTSFYFLVKFSDGECVKYHPALLEKVKSGKQRPVKKKKKRALRAGDIVNLPRGFSMSEERNKALMETRAVVTCVEEDFNNLILQFATDMILEIQSDVVTFADMSGQIIEEGDIVVVGVDREKFRKLQMEVGNYKAQMDELLGKAGRLMTIDENDKAIVQYANKSYTINVRGLKLLYKAEEVL